MRAEQSIRLLLVPGFVALGAVARAQTIERVSLTSSGGEPNHDCLSPKISADGNVVAFSSQATNIVPGDTNGLTDLFVRDRVAQTTARVNVGNAGQQSTLAFVSPPHLSADGRLILFDASGLDPADTDPESDVYLLDRLSGVTTFVSTSTQFTHHFAAAVTPDGRKVIYSSSSSSAPAVLTTLDLLTGVSTSVAIPQPPPTATQAYYQGGSVSGDGRFYDFGRVVDFPTHTEGALERLDLATGALTRILDNTYFESPMQTSLDGRFVLYTNYGVPFVSGSTSLYRLDTNSGATVRIDVSLVPPTWGSGGFGVQSASMSSNGAYVAFTSDDSNIVQPDPDPVHNAFVRVPAQFGTLRVDYAPQGTATDGAAEEVSLTASGNRIAFSSWYDQFVAGDTNQRRDVFVRAVCGPHHPDLDQDGHGALGSASTTQCLPAPTGWSVSAGDCDDASANVHPFAFDGCDGLDNDCDNSTDEDSSGSSFCIPSSNASQTCVTAIGASGCLSLAPGGSFVVTATNLDPQRAGLLFYGVGDEITIPWGAGGASYLCVSPPRQRTTAASTGGAGSCSGALSLDLAAWLTAHPTALGAPFSGGEVLSIQGWYRDPGAPLSTSLTSALRAAVTP